MKRYAMEIMAGLILLSGCAFAGSQVNIGSPSRGEHRVPPPEAFAACQGQSAGATVEMAAPWGEKIKATCRLMDGKLVAAPEGGPQGHRMPPPSDK